MPKDLTFTRFVTAVTLLLSATVIPVHAATILTDNLSAVTAGTESASGSTWITGSFGTDGSQCLLDSITLLLANSSTGSVYNGTDCVTGSSDDSETSLRLADDSSHAVASFNIVLDLANGNPNCGGTASGGAPPTGGPGGGPPPGGTPPAEPSQGV